MKTEKLFRITGKVLDKDTSIGLGGLIVEALDKDLFADDRLGSTTTAKDGSFEIIYDKSDFKELFFDNKPDIYLRVNSPDGKLLYTSKDCVRYNAGKVEAFVIYISGYLTPPINLQKIFSQVSVVLNRVDRKATGPDAKVTLKGKNGDYTLTYNKGNGRYQASEVKGGTYLLKAETKDGLSGEKDIHITNAKTLVRLSLGKKETPFYNMGGDKIHFMPPKKDLAILFDTPNDKKLVGQVLDLPIIKNLKAIQVTDLPYKGDLDNIGVIRVNEDISDKNFETIREAVVKIRGVKDLFRPERDLDLGLVLFTNEVIVKFQMQTTRPQVERIIKKYNLETLREFSYAPNTYLFKAKGRYGYALTNLAEELDKLEETVYAEPNLHHTMEDDLVPGDFLYAAHQWHLPLIGAEAAWDITTGDNNITICVHDRGLWIDGSGNPHPDFDTTGLGWDKIHSPWDFQDMNNTTPFHPTNNHGTQCCGVATALQSNGGEGVTGLAPNCRLIPTRRYNSNSTDNHADAYIWASGFDPGSPDPSFPVPPTSPADVIVSSFGSNGLALSGLMRDAFDFITTFGRDGKGCVMVFSAGNGTTDVANRTWASYEKTICIGGSTNLETHYGFSNFGEELDVVAPTNGGTDSICTTAFVGGGNLAGSAAPGASLDYLDTFGGTSSAAPLTAGLIALVLSANPDLTWIQVRDILRNTAVKIDPTNNNTTGRWLDVNGNPSNTSGLAPVYSNWYGYGRIDALAAVQAADDLVGVDPLNNVDTWIKENISDVGNVPSGQPYSQDVWVRNTSPALDNPAQVTIHQPPIREQDNWVYANIRNRGVVDSSDVYVRISITRWAGTQYVYPDDFIPTIPPSTTPTIMAPGTYLIGEVHIDSIPAGGFVTINTVWPEELIPPATVTVDGVDYSWADSCLLVEVSPHDGPSTTGNHTWDNNNICQRNITILDADDSDDELNFAFVVGHYRNLDDLIHLRIDRQVFPAGVKLFFDIADNDLAKKTHDLLERFGRREIYIDPCGNIRPRKQGPKNQTKGNPLITHDVNEWIPNYQLKPVQLDNRLVFALPPKGNTLLPVIRNKGEFQVAALRLTGLKTLKKGEYQLDIYQQGTNGRMEGGINLLIRKK